MAQDQSTDKAWSRVGLFLSRDILERRYRERHGLDLSAGKAAEIIAHLEQARQYFHSAQSAGALAGPLEQYYGVLAFARAIILYVDPRAREATLKKGHGLNASMPDDAKLENIQITVQSGTFDDFLTATGNSELLCVDLPKVGSDHSRLEETRSLPRPSTGSRFGFLDLLSRVPDLREHYEASLEEAACCYEGHVWWFMASLTIQVVPGLFGPPELARLRNALGLPETTEVVAGAPHDSSLKLSISLNPGDSIVSMAPHILGSPDGGQTVIERFPGDWCLSELATHFAAAHVLSMIVRYHPTHWMRLVNHEKGDRLLPVLDRLRNVIQDRFVWLALWELERSVSAGKNGRPRFKVSGCTG